MMSDKKGFHGGGRGAREPAGPEKTGYEKKESLEVTSAKNKGCLASKG